jgi:transcriptional regulator with XRE-family HTH domain
MVSGEAFGPNLRRLRRRRGVSLEAIAAATNVPVAVWQALEDDDLYGWPSGVLARARIQAYARVIAVDPSDVVNDFCRLFPKGDRRRTRVVVEFAALIGQEHVSTDDVPPGQERRGTRQLQERRTPSRGERLRGALVKCAAILVGS